MVDKPLPGCAEGCVLLLLDDSHPPALGIPVLGVYIFSPCCVAFARSSLSFFLRALSGVFLFLTLVYCYLQDLCSFLKAALLGLPWRLDLGAALEIWLCCAGFMVKLVLF